MPPAVRAKEFLLLPLPLRPGKSWLLVDCDCILEDLPGRLAGRVPLDRGRGILVPICSLWDLRLLEASDRPLSKGIFPLDANVYSPFLHPLNNMCSSFALLHNF